MSTFSIQTNIISAFNLYKKHIVLMVSMAATIGVVFLSTSQVVAFVENKLCVTVQGQGGKVILYEENHYKGASGSLTTTTPIWKKNWNHVSTFDWVYFGLIVAMTLFFPFVVLGVMRVALDLQQRNKTSYRRLFVGPGLFMSVLKSNILFQFFTLGKWFKMAFMVMIPLLIVKAISEMLGIVIFSIAALYLFYVILSYCLRYTFSTFFILDKKETAYKALNSSFDMTQGSTNKLMLLFLFIISPFLFSFTFICSVFDLLLIGGPLIKLTEVSFGIILAIWWPFTTLVYAGVYKELNSNKIN